MRSVPDALVVQDIGEVPAAWLGAFRSGDADLDEFLVTHALLLESAALSRTAVGVLEASVAGFVTICADSVVLTQRERRPLAAGQIKTIAVPAVKVARLATAESFRGRGVGTQLMRYAALEGLRVSDRIGCRLLTVDAYVVAVPFYESLGFVRNGSKEYKERRNVSMRLDLHSPELPAWIFPDRR